MIRLHLADRFDTGAFADLFSPPGEKRAYKLFKRRDQNGLPDPHQKDHELMRRAICDSEIAAYRLLQSHPHLAHHAPQFFGHAPVTDVLDSEGRSIKDDYLLDCCYCMSHIQGRAEKVSGGREKLPHAASLLREFEQVGISYVRDCSAFFLCDPVHICLIDFGIEDRHGQLSEEIAMNGKLSEKQMARWSRPLGDSPRAASG